MLAALLRLKTPQMYPFPKIIPKKVGKPHFPLIWRKMRWGRGGSCGGSFAFTPPPPPRGRGSARVAHDCCSAKVRFAVTQVAPGAARHAACGTKTLCGTRGANVAFENATCLSVLAPGARGLAAGANRQSCIGGRRKQALVYWLCCYRVIVSLLEALKFDQILALTGSRR
jgi:hypothetical protein